MSEDKKSSSQESPLIDTDAAQLDLDKKQDERARVIIGFSLVLVALVLLVIAYLISSQPQKPRHFPPFQDAIGYVMGAGAIIIINLIAFWKNQTIRGLSFALLLVGLPLFGELFLLLFLLTMYYIDKYL